MPRPYKILFVCMGNICRSPAAEGVMHHLLEREGLAGSVVCDSAGTIGMHSGSLPDPRMRRAAARRSIRLESRARRIQAADLGTFDLILTMDADNEADVRRLDRDATASARIRPFAPYCQKHRVTAIPDPYYGGEEGFEHVLDLLLDGCTELLKQTRATISTEH